MEGWRGREGGRGIDGWRVGGSDGRMESGREG